MRRGRPRRQRLRGGRRAAERGARVVAVDAPTRADASRERAHILRHPRRRRAARRRARLVAVPDGHRPRRHLAGLAPRPARCSSRPPRPASRSGARSSWPGGCAPARRRGARGSPSRAPTARPPPSTCSRRSCGPPGCARPPPATSAPRSLEAVLHPEPLRRARRRAVQLPAALAATRSAPGRRPPCLNVAPDHLDWHGSLEDVPAGQGPGLRRTPRSPASTTCRTRVTEQLVDGRRRRRGLPGDRLHPRRPRPVDGRASSTTSWSTGPSSSSARTSAAELATLADLQGDAPSVAPHNVANALAAAALARAYGVAAGRRPRRAARVRARPAPDRRRRRRRRGPLRRRLQGDQPARRGRLAAGVRARRLGRRRPGQGRRRRRPRRAPRPTGCAGSCSSAPTGPGSPRRWRDTRPMSPSSRSTRHGHWGSWTGVVARGRRAGRSPATSCCSRRRPRRWTCSPTTRARGDAFAAAVHATRAGPEGLGIVSSHHQHRRDRRPRRRHASRGWRRRAVRLGERLDSPRDHATTCCSARPLLLVVIGLVMVLSASSVTSLSQTTARPTPSSSSQLRFAVIGVSPMLVAGRVPVRAWKRLGGAACSAGRSLLQLLVFTPLGVDVNGNRNWIASAAVQAAALRVRQDRPRPGRRRPCWPQAALLGRVAARRRARCSARSAAVLLGLVLRATTSAPRWSCWRSSARCSSSPGSRCACSPSPARPRSCSRCAMVVTSANRMGRISTWLARRRTPTRTAPCCQTLHGLYALADGGWWGVGLGASREKWEWLPEAHNDFIFAIIGEELGLPGTLVRARPVRAPGLGLLPARRAHRRPLRPDRHAPGSWPGSSVQAIINIGAVIGAAARSSACRCRWSPPAGRRSSRRCSALGMLMSFARNEPGAARPCRPGRRVVRRSLAVLPARRRGGRRCADRTVRRSCSPAAARPVTSSPLLALADCLRRRDPDVRITALGTETGLEARLVPGPRLHAAHRPQGAAARAARRPTWLRLPGALRGAVRRGRRGDRRSRRRGRRRLRRLRLDPGLPRRAPRGRSRSSCTSRTPAPAWPTGSGARMTALRGDDVRGHGAAPRAPSSGCRCGARSPSSTGPPRRAEALAHFGLDRHLARPCSSPAARSAPSGSTRPSRTRVDGAARRRRAGAARHRRWARSSSPAADGSGAAVRRAAVRRPDGPRLRRRRPRRRPRRCQHGLRADRGRPAGGLRPAARSATASSGSTRPTSSPPAGASWSTTPTCTPAWVDATLLPLLADRDRLQAMAAASAAVGRARGRRAARRPGAAPPRTHTEGTPVSTPRRPASTSARPRPDAATLGPGALHRHRRCRHVRRRADHAGPGHAPSPGPTPRTPACCAALAAEGAVVHVGHDAAHVDAVRHGRHLLGHPRVQRRARRAPGRAGCGCCTAARPWPP